jgi:hypothetical protein
MEKITLDDLVLMPCYYGFKFGSKDNLNDLRNGHLYMKNLGYYVNEELQTGIRGRGDKYEALMFYSDIVKAYDPETHVLLFTGKAEVRNNKDTKKPVFCMMAKNIFQNPISLNFPQLTTKVIFDLKLLDDFSEKGANTYMIIFTDLPEFFRRVEEAIKPQNIRLFRDFVKYRDTNALWKTENGIEYNDVFCKRECFRHQEEYRILLDTIVDDHFDINIGDISDITSNVIGSENIVKSGILIDINIREYTELEK